MSYTREQIYDAMRAADAAGDADAVRKLMGALEAPEAGPKKPALMSRMQNLAAGGLRGAGSIGATLMGPQDVLEDALTKMLGGKNGPKSRNDQRREDMTGALQGMGVDTASGAFQVGKMGGEVAGTLGAGPAVAGALGAVPSVAARAAPVLSAINSSGMSAGGLAGVPGLAARTVGGAVTGGASAGLADPTQAGMGAVIGGVLPGAVQLAGYGGRAVGEVFKPASTKAAQRLAKALEDDPAAISAKLLRARELVPGSKPTVAQVLRTPQAGTLERIVSESAGGSGLKSRYADQNAARFGLLDAVAPVDPRGFRTAQQDFGAAALDVTRSGDKAARGATRAAYESLPQDEAAFYLPDLAGVRDEMFTSGSFAARGAVDDAVKTSQRIGLLEVPGIVAARPAASGQTLSQAVRKLGGLSLNNNGGLRGEVAGLRGDLKNLVRTNGGVSPDDMAAMMYERGYIADESADTLIEALKSESRGGRAGSMFDSPDRAMAAARDAAMGDAPGAQLVPQKVTLRQFDDLRKDIGSAQREAAKAGRDREALALSKMKEAMDDRVNEVVRGDGQIDENLPIDWANKLDEARKLKLAQVQTFRTGPQSEAFRTGSDGLPKMQGGEFAPKVWGNRAGIADDIQQFRKVMDSKPELLGQFRSMITTEGASTATAGGNLTSKFVKWVENSLPGLKASFEPGQVKMLQRIAADIKRANVADAVGAAKGSPTFQNASNALSLGLLDSPLLGLASSKVPLGLGSAVLDGVRGPAREKMARELARYLSDPALAAQALEQLSRPVAPGLLGAGSVRAIPAGLLALDQ